MPEIAAEFVTSAVRPEQYPAEGLPEIAFLGRSNVGKSSLLNCLTATQGLARTSSRPGCTQLINFFRVDGRWMLVDLPGYGFARAPEEVRRQWRPLVEQYLRNREALALCCVLMDARFIISAARPDQFPNGTGLAELPEVAFLGRSNVGKSSLLNALTGARDLAFTSARPGCTQSINFFRIGEELMFADFPGYGYARVPKEIRGEWKGLIEQYLLTRRPLKLCVLLLDSRRGWMEKDVELKEWLEFHNRRYVVIATKTDKLKTQKERFHGMAAIREAMNGDGPLPFSAINCRGVREIWQAISKTRNG